MAELQFLAGIDLLGNPLVNPVLNPLAAAPANANPFYVYTNTADGLIYQNTGTYAAPVWRPVGAVLSVNGKTGVVVLTQDDVGDGGEYVRTHNDLTDALKAQITANQTAIGVINGKIPSAATSANQLADKAYVTELVQTTSAHFRGNWNTWADVPSSAADYPADDDGNTTPTTNDYMVVGDASGYPVDAGADPLAGTWRFKYTGAWAANGKNGWQPEYQVNESPMTQAQLAAINSGITAAGVSQISDNQTAIQQTRVMICNVEAGSTASASYASGDLFILGGVLYRATGTIAEGGAITPGTNCAATTIEALLAAKQDALTFDAAPTQGSQNPVTSGGVYTAIQNAAGSTVKKATGTISTSTTSASVSYSGTLINAYATMGGAIVMTDIAVGAASVTFSCDTAPSDVVTCVVIYS